MSGLQSRHVGSLLKEKLSIATIYVESGEFAFWRNTNQTRRFCFCIASCAGRGYEVFCRVVAWQKFSPKTGIVWWNLRDGWPIISDAIVDYYNSKKMAYYFIKNAQTDLCVLINDPVDNGYPLIVANDTRNLQKGQVIVSDMASNKEIYKGNFEVWQMV